MRNQNEKYEKKSLLDEILEAVFSEMEKSEAFTNKDIERLRKVKEIGKITNTGEITKALENEGKQDEN